jgi:hypothetical protein
MTRQVLGRRSVALVQLPLGYGFVKAGPGFLKHNAIWSGAMFDSRIGECCGAFGEIPVWFMDLTPKKIVGWCAPPLVKAIAIRPRDL